MTARCFGRLGLPSAAAARALTASPCTAMGAIRDVVSMPRVVTTRIAVVLTSLLACVSAAAQPDQAATPQGFRRLAPGVLTVIPPNEASDISPEAVFRQEEFFEITLASPAAAWDPHEAAESRTLRGRAEKRGESNVDEAKILGYPFRHAVWCLEFAYKPPRQIDIDVPVDGLRMQRTRVWYLVYRVKNIGGRRAKAEVGDGEQLQKLIDEGAFEPDKLKVGTQLTETFDTPITFLPHFVLQSEEALTPREGLTAYRSYLDRLIPGAAEAIQAREDRSRRLYDSASISETPLEPGEERWGVAVWEGIDPRIDYFTIFVKGLTNRFLAQPATTVDEIVNLDRFALQSLRLDFWRPGDDRDNEPAQMMVGSSGLLPRRVLGTALIESASRGVMTRARPTAGLARLGLSWEELLDDPDEGLWEPGVAVSLRSLTTLLESLSKADEPLRATAAEEVLGMVAARELDSLLQSIAAPLPGEAAAARSAAIAELGLDETAGPLAQLAAFSAAIDRQPQIARQQALERSMFGDRAALFDRVADAARRARTIAVLDALRLDVREFAALGPLAAFDRLAERRGAIAGGMQPADGGEWPPADLVLAGLFGAEGPNLYVEAQRNPPGIDYAWVFQYEN